MLFVSLVVMDGAVAQTHALRSGWNLVGNDSGADVNSVNVFGDTSTPNAISPQVTSIWSWDSLNSRWNFYAPNMTATALSSYASSKGYGVLSTIPKGEGFWVNATQALTLPLVVSTPTIEGAYQGTLAGSASNSFSLLVLENGDFWTMYGTSTSSGLAVAGSRRRGRDGSGVSGHHARHASHSGFCRPACLAPVLSDHTAGFVCAGNLAV
jgi:hypothetical protein